MAFVGGRKMIVVSNKPRIISLVFVAATAAALCACETMNSNADATHNNGPNGNGANGDPGGGYTNSGKYDPNNPPAKGFHSNCGGELLMPLPGQPIVRFAQAQGGVAAPVATINPEFGVLTNPEWRKATAWGAGGGGGGAGGKNPC